MSDHPSPIDFGLTGKAALVVGTGSGMGGATVAALAAAGAKIACFDLDGAAAEVAAKTVTDAGGTAISLSGDATAAADLARAVGETQKAFGSVDVVVSVVGNGTSGARLLDTDEATWDRTFDLCLKTAVNAVRAAVGPMIEQGRGGSFAFISSIGGISGLPGQAPYSAAKAGLMSLVKTLALEYGMEGIRFNAVAPGTIVTDEIQKISTPESLDTQRRQIPMRTLGKPQDVAKALLFLSSDLAGYVNGQTLSVDGGVTSKFQIHAFWADWEND